MQKVIIAIVAMFVLGGLAAAILLYGGFVSVAADQTSTEAEEWLLRTAMRQAVIRAADDLQAPPLEGRERLLAGITGFDDMCVSCHGAPGVEPAVFAEHMNPKPPRLQHAAGEWTPEQIFWITNHGIEMTGMPAWGPVHSEDEIWDLVAVVKHLPEMSAQEYQALRREAERSGRGHGSGGASGGSEHGHHHDQPH